LSCQLSTYPESQLAFGKITPGTLVTVEFSCKLPIIQWQQLITKYSDEISAFVFRVEII
jgi:hypothetical protein